MEKRIRKVFLFIVLMCSVFLVGCITTMPATNIVMKARQGTQEFHIHVQKGYLNEENRGLTWMTEEEYEKFKAD